MISRSLKDTQDFAKKFVQALNTSGDSAFVVGLYGNLGAGKTTLIQMIAKEMGVEDIVNSPTFVIEKIYYRQVTSKSIANLLMRILGVLRYNKGHGFPRQKQKGR